MLPRTRLETVRTAPRPISTGHLLADCERWCRDNLPRGELLQGRTTLRLVAAPVAEPTPSRRGTFRPGPGWPGIEFARTGS